MKKSFFYILTFLGLNICVCLIPSKEQKTRRPASSQSEAIDSIKKVCDQSTEKEKSYVICGGYNIAKKNVEKEVDRYSKAVIETLPEPVTAVSGFLLKTLYEKRILVEVQTSVGDPSVSISNGETNVGWKFNYNF